MKKTSLTAQIIAGALAFLMIASVAYVLISALVQ